MALNPTPLALSRIDNWGPSIQQVGQTASNAMVIVQPTFNFFSIASGTPTFEVHWFACTSAQANISSDVTDGVFANTLPAGCTEVAGTQTNDSYTATSSEQGKYLGVWTKATVAGDWRAVWSKTTSAALIGAPVAPVVSTGSPASANLSDTGVTINYSVSTVGNLGWSVRAAASAAPTVSNLSTSSWQSADLVHGRATLMSSGAGNFSVTGLTAGTDYVAYIGVIGGGGNSNLYSFAFTTTGGSSSNPVSAQPPVLTPEQAKNQIKPLPVIVQPLVAALPALSKPLVDAGGKVDLTAGDFTGLVSASISGKPLDLTVASTGGLTITVPNGKAGTTADLLLNFKSGTVILQDAIKYIAPVVVSAVPERSVSISAGSAKLSDASANQIRQAAFANMANTNIVCVAYAANGSAAAKAAALATAEQACALATKANPNLVAAPVTVIVNKAKAKTSAVGIKVYH